MNVFDALGNPVRRDILLALRDRPRTVVDIAALFPVSRPAISRHLRVLADAGLVEPRPHGAATLYAVRPEGLEAARDYLGQFWDAALAHLQELARGDA